MNVLTMPPVSQWRVTALIGLGWYDGLTQGVCLAADPPCSVMFEVLGYEAPSHGSETRLFRLWSCSPELTATLLSRLAKERESTGEVTDGSVHEIVWFPTQSPDQEALDALLARLVEERVALPVVAEARGEFQLARLWWLASAN